MGAVAALSARAAPRSRDAHLVAEDGAHQLFLPNGSRLFDIDAELAAAFDKALASSRGDAVRALLTAHGLEGPIEIDHKPPADLAVRALSLAVAQTLQPWLQLLLRAGRRLRRSGEEHAGGDSLDVR